MMLEQNDEWSLNRRYMLEGLQTLSDTAPTRLSAVARSVPWNSAVSGLWTYTTEWDATNASSSTSTSSKALEALKGAIHDQRRSPSLIGLSPVEYGQQGPNLLRTSEEWSRRLIELLRRGAAMREATSLLIAAGTASPSGQIAITPS